MNISNDKKSFYQWETNRFLVDEDFKINQEVCFSSVKLRKALVVKTKLKNNKIVVEVPNLLLQDYHPIMVHWVIADENGKYVTKEQEFQVLKRAKPEDYVYTETEIFSFLDLEQRLKNLEEEGINKAIADYFVKNPIQSGATSEQAAQIIQNKENIEKLNKNKLDADKLPEAINNALAQAEASGVFKGEPGKDGVVPVTGAAVGQTVKITAVDENGNPTEWEATDFPESSTQADWNQNDESAVDYIKNRTHYEEETTQAFSCETAVNPTNTLTYLVCTYDELPLVAGQELTLWFKQKSSTEYSNSFGSAIVEEDENGDLVAYIPSIDNQRFIIRPTEISAMNSDMYNANCVSLKITGESIVNVVHQLDQKYIPNADWSQSDENGTGYIKNRTHYDDTVYTPKTKNEINSIFGGPLTSSELEVVDGITFRVVVDGVIYDDVPIYEGCYAAGSYTWGIGDVYMSNTAPATWKTTDYGFCYSGYGLISNSDVFPNGIQSIEIYTVEKRLKQLDPKYIKDMYYETPSVWIKAELIDDNWSGRATCKLASTPIEWTVDNSYRIRIDGVEYVFDGMSTRKATAATGMQDVYYIGATYIPLNSNMDFLEYKFCLLTTDFTNIYVVFEDATTNHIIEFFESESVIHHLDPKYIKDMYHEEPVELFSVENAEFVDNAYMLETPFVIGDGNTYIVNWDGVEYTCEAYIFEGIPAIGNTAEFGGKGNGEPFVIGYNSYENVTFVNSFEDLATHTFSVVEIVCHTIDPKYIKDMYYEEENLVNIAGLEYFVINPMSNGVTEYTYDYIPLELGQTWDVCYNPSNNDNFTAGDYSSMPVQEDEDGNLYIGDPEVNTYPFYITSNFIRVNANWYSIIRMTVVKIVGVSGTYTDDPIVHQIDTKYLPILEKIEETIIKANVTDFIELTGPEYGKLLGKYIVVIDGVSKTVEFIDDGIGSSVETDSFFIESWTDPEGNVDNNGFAMGFIPPDNIVHSVKIARVKDVIKEEYLPVTAKPDWEQGNPNGAGYIANRTHYDDKNHCLIDGAFVNLDINQLYTVQIYDDIYENVPVYNAGTNNDPRWGVGDMRVVNYPFGFFKYPCWPSNDIINTELSMISFDRNIYPNATINDVQIYQRVLKQLDEKYIPDSVKGMLVTVSEDAEGNLVASNNSEEIIAAYEAGVCVRLEYNGLVHDLTLIMENMPIFLCMVPNSQTNIGVYMIVVNADYTINVQEESYNIPTIDATLAIEGAAADAKATGDAISAVSALVGDVAVSEQISSALAESAIPIPTTAQVGQLLSVKAVDENGKPTEWEAVDVSNIEGSNGIGIKSIRIEEVM